MPGPGGGAGPPAPPRWVVATAAATALGQLLAPAIGIPLGATGSTVAALTALALASPFLVGTAVLRARPRHGAMWLVPAIVLHLVVVTPALPTVITTGDLVVVVQAVLALGGVATLVGVGRSGLLRGVRGAGPPPLLLGIGGLAALAPLFPIAGFRTPSGPPLEGWVMTSVAGTDLAGGVYLAVQVLVVVGGLVLVRRLRPDLAAVAILAWVGPVAVVGLITLVEVIREPILVALPLGVIGLVLLWATFLLALRQRSRPAPAPRSDP